MRTLLLVLASFSSAHAVEQTPVAPVSPWPETAGQATNSFASVNQLKGRYFVMRHGESVPSSEKRVCTSLEAGKSPRNGLTANGRIEVSTSITNWIKTDHDLIQSYLKKCKFKIVSSPFSRTRETAEIAKAEIVKEFKKDISKKCNIFVRSLDDLKERSFGDFEGKLNSGDIYQSVWSLDKLNPDNRNSKVESPNDVQTRASFAISKLDRKNPNTLFLVVSHGDTLKILQTAFQKKSASAHVDPSVVAPFSTAEIRELKL